MARFFVVFLLLFSCPYSFARARKPKRAPSHTAERAYPATPAIDPAVVNNPATTDELGPKQTGSAVVRAQILLDRAHFSVGEIDGLAGANMQNTVRAYQSSHNMPPDGTVNGATWAALNTDTQPPLVTYTIVQADVAGPFNQVPADMLEQAKLPALGFSSPLEELAERFHASPKLLKDLNPGKRFDSAGEQILVPNVNRTPIAGEAALIVVKKSCSCVEVFDAQNQLLAHYPATMGSEHDPLPIGEWKVSKPLWNPVFHYNSNLFWDADEKNAKADIKPGPNNPVGVVWIGLSKEHYGIHGTPEPSTIGRTQSHGCIRLTNWDATELGNMVKPGMTASLREA